MFGISEILDVIGMGMLDMDLFLDLLGWVRLHLLMRGILRLRVWRVMLVFRVVLVDRVCY